TNYAIVAAPLLLAQLGCVTVYLLASAASAEGGAPSLLFVVGSTMFLAGLCMFAALGVVNKHALSSLARLLDRVGGGDFSLHFLPGWGDISEGQTVWTALNKMNKEFPKIVRQVRTSAQNIADGSREIALGYADLSKRTEEQATTLEETAASMEQVSATVKQNADHCRDADVAVRAVGGQAEDA